MFYVILFDDEDSGRLTVPMFTHIRQYGIGLPHT